MDPQQEQRQRNLLLKQHCKINSMSWGIDAPALFYCRFLDSPSCFEAVLGAAVQILYHGKGRYQAGAV